MLRNAQLNSNWDTISFPTPVTVPGFISNSVDVSLFPLNLYLFSLKGKSRILWGCMTLYWSSLCPTSSISKSVYPHLIKKWSDYLLQCLSCLNLCTSFYWKKICGVILEEYLHQLFASWEIIFKKWFWIQNFGPPL